MPTPTYLEVVVKAAIDIASHGLSGHLDRKNRQQQLVKKYLLHPESAVFQKSISPLRESAVWGGLVSAKNPDGTRSKLTRYLAYLHEDATPSLVVLEGDGEFHTSPSDPDVFKQKWDVFTGN